MKKVREEGFLNVLERFMDKHLRQSYWVLNKVLENIPITVLRRSLKKVVEKIVVIILEKIPEKVFNIDLEKLLENFQKEMQLTEET